MVQKIARRIRQAIFVGGDGLEPTTFAMSIRLYLTVSGYFLRLYLLLGQVKGIVTAAVILNYTDQGDSDKSHGRRNQE